MADKDTEKYRICDKCSSKFYLRGVYAKHKEEWDAKQMTLQGFQNDIEKRTEELKQKQATINQRREQLRIQGEQFASSLAVLEKQKLAAEKANATLKERLEFYTSKATAQQERYQQLTREKNEKETTIAQRYCFLATVESKPTTRPKLRSRPCKTRYPSLSLP